MKIIALVLLNFLWLSGCSSGDSQRGMTRKNTLVVAWAKDITTLDPACADGWESAEVISQIYEGLVYEDPDTHQVKMRLAQSVKSSENGLVWDVKVREGIKFHNGMVLNAQAVAFSFKRQMEAVQKGTSSKYNCNFSYWKAYFNMIDDVKVISDYAVRFTLKYNYAPFLKMLEIFSVYIVAPFSEEKPDSLDKNPVGTGPFKIHRRMEGRVVLKRNSAYWNSKLKASYEYLVFQTIPENRQRVLALEGGQADIAYHLDPEGHLAIGLHPSLALKKVQSVNVAYLALNTQKYPFSIRQNRIAANHLIDRDKINKMVYQGTGDTANAPIPPYLTIDGIKIYKKSWPWYEYNQARALELFREGGFAEQMASKPLNLYVIRNPRGTLPNPLLMANLIRNDFRRMGIEVKIHALEYRDYKTALATGKHEMAIHSWIGDLWDPDNFLFGLLHYSSTGTNYSKFNDSAYNEAVYKGRTIDKPSLRAEFYRKALDIFKNEAPWVPLVYAKIVVAYNKRVLNLKHNMDTTTLYNLVRLED
ncbi:hypothetical protein KKF34_07140 [Myxococcota bacterium]|nr:hypothetical protein [Myxococcota bacterium]MBU1382240.1 hypothetical protein [Myxococcota bacterium]MBU1496637.1 hypothetical protein [Myxococcota bacterium]